MSKWTDLDWWLGRTEDQQRRKAEARQGLRDSWESLKAGSGPSNSGDISSDAPAEEPTSEKPWWKKPWGIAVIVVVVIAVMNVCSGDEEAADQPADEPAAQEEVEDLEEAGGEIADEAPEQDPEKIAEELAEEETEQPEEPPGSLEMTPDEFVERWNAATTEFERADLRVDDLDIQEGQVQDIFQVRLADYVFLQGTVSQGDDGLKEITILGGPETQEQSLTVLTTWGLAVSATSPELNPDERGDVLRDLGIVGDDTIDFSDHEAETVRGDVRYWVQFSDAIGLIFGVDDARHR